MFDVGLPQQSRGNMAQRKALMRKHSQQHFGHHIQVVFVIIRKGLLEDLISFSGKYVIHKEVIIYYAIITWYIRNYHYNYKFMWVMSALNPSLQKGTSIRLLQFGVMGIKTFKGDKRSA
jgi:hypothetical protein